MSLIRNTACTLLLAFLLTVSPIETAKSSQKPKTAPPRTSAPAATIEGSATIPKHLADTEVQGSGYPNDDEDGDDIHASGHPPPPPSAPKPTSTPKKNHGGNVGTPVTTTTVKPFVTTVKPIVSPKPVATVDRQKEVIVDEDDDDDEEDDEDDEDDEFEDEKIDEDITTITQPPVIYREPETTTTRAPAVTTKTPKSSTQPDFSGPFSPFHETMTNGIFAAVAGGMLVAVITAILLVLFVVFRIRKKDEGSYALDEPKPRPYVGYAYTKASTKEFYA